MEATPRACLDYMGVTYGLPRGLPRGCLCYVGYLRAIKGQHRFTKGPFKRSHRFP